MDFLFECLAEIVVDLLMTIFYGTAEETMNEKKPLALRIILGSILGLILAGELTLLIFGIVLNNITMITLGAVLLFFYIFLIVIAFLHKPY